MIFTIRCGCSRVLSIGKGKYWEERNTIMNNDKLKKTEKEVAAAALLKKYGIIMYCCRTKVMGEIEYHKIVIT